MPERSRRLPGVDPAISEAMSRVRSKDTTPEMVVRRLAHSLGYRFRLHRKDLAGTPDLVFPSRGKVVFVHGCFWHGHDDPNCKRARTPKSRVEFWENKVKRNRARDASSIAALEDAGWQVLVVWECETPIGKRHDLEQRLKNFLL